MNTWFTGIFLIAVVLILVAGAKVSRNGTWNEDFLSLSVSKGVLGLFAVCIVLHHLAQTLGEEAGALGILENIGVCFVGGFFFFSGYGLLKSFQKKTDYLKGFFGKRFPAILIPFYVIVVIFFLVSLSVGEKFTAGETVAFLTGWHLINSHMWYIVEIALFYVVFYVIFKVIRSIPVALTMLTVFIAGFTVFCLFLGHGEYWFQGEWWYNTSLLFAIGAITAYHEKTILSFAKRFFYPLLIAGTGITAILYVATNYMLENYSYYSEYMYADGRVGATEKFMCLSCQLPMVIFFIATFLLFTMKVQFKNPVMSFLGTISLELYLIHNLFIQLFRNPYFIMIKNPFVYVVAVVTCSICTATLLHFILTIKEKKIDK